MYSGGEKMNPEGRVYAAIDLKSFYASVECVDRGLDPLKARLVVADATRTEKTICLAVSPALKAYGIPGRARLFEVVQKVRQINAFRRRGEPELDYIVAPPRMKRYMEVSGIVYGTYLEFVAPEDIFAYSVDEVFIDLTPYLASYKCSAHELTMRMVRAVLRKTGVTATAGIGTNMFLAKVAMDIEAKHSEADADGVRIAELDEMSFRRKYWSHRPLTDFWRIGRGLAAKLESRYMYTLGDVARCSLQNEEVLYKMFGVNAELLIDHAWGWEPTTIADVKSYKPSAKSLSSGQVLSEPYTNAKARVVVREMADSLVMDLVSKGLLTDQMVLTVVYDIDNLKDDAPGGKPYAGEIVLDYYGRPAPKPAHGSINLPRPTCSTELVCEAVMTLFDRIADPSLLVRRIYVVANNTVPESEIQGTQMMLFDSDPQVDEKERRRQQAILDIRKKYGKNAILKGMNYDEGATARERNAQVGGHKG